MDLAVARGNERVKITCNCQIDGFRLNIQIL